MGANYRHRGPGAATWGPSWVRCGGGAAGPKAATYDFLRSSMRGRIQVRAFRHLASDSSPCACPIDLRGVQKGDNGFQKGVEKGLPLSSGSKIRANGCRGKAPETLQSGRPLQPELCRPLPLQPFGGSVFCSVIYVLAGVAGSTCFAYAGDTWEPAFYGALGAGKALQSGRQPSVTQATAAEGEAFSQKGLSRCSGCLCNSGVPCFTSQGDEPGHRVLRCPQQRPTLQCFAGPHRTVKCGLPCLTSIRKTRAPRHTRELVNHAAERAAPKRLQRERPAQLRL